MSDRFPGYVGCGLLGLCRRQQGLVFDLNEVRVGLRLQRLRWAAGSTVAPGPTRLVHSGQASSSGCCQPLRLPVSSPLSRGFAARTYVQRPCRWRLGHDFAHDRRPGLTSSALNGGGPARQAADEMRLAQLPCELQLRQIILTAEIRSNLSPPLPQIRSGSTRA